MEQIGALAKCAPPLRAKSEQDALWEHLLSGNIATIGSDHSPSPPEMKRDANFLKIWGGISGVQHTLPLLLASRSRREALTLENFRTLVAKLISFNVAERFHLPSTKGRLGIGADADLAIVDLKQSFTVRAEELFYRHKQSPYVGRALTGRVVRTILRGQTVYHDGKIVSSPMGQLIKPSH
jgi:allantoinase